MSRVRGVLLYNQSLTKLPCGRSFSPFAFYDLSTIMTVAPDEETPLLANTEHTEPKKAPTPLPWAQLSIVLFLQLAEPLTSQVIYVSSTID